MNQSEAKVKPGLTLTIFISIWSLILCLSLTWNIHTHRQNTRENARIEARVAFHKDVISRRWNAMKEGVYVPATEETPPNPYLKVPERDIMTPTGKKLTMVNPAYMTRQVHELQQKEGWVLGHITSLNPLKPENTPDKWERGALETFQRGEKEYSSLEYINNTLYMRLMRPLITEESCLKCHSEQGYKKGDIRGGISVAVPMEPIVGAARSEILAVTTGHGIIWLVGIIGIFLWVNYYRKKSSELNQYLEELHIKETAIKASSNAIVITDKDGEITYANDIFFKLWKFNKKDFLGKSIFSAIKISNSPIMLSQLSEMKSWFGEVTARRDDGSEFFVLLSAGIIAGKNNEDPIGFTFSFSDITMRKNAELALKESEASLKQRNMTMEKDLKIAQLLQRELLGKKIPSSSFMDIDCRYLPVEKVGGDYFSFFDMEKDIIGIFISDVSGHGVAPALFHSLIKSSTEKLCNTYCTKPKDFLYELNNDLSGHMSSYFITGLYGYISPINGDKSMKFTFANGGHPPPIVIQNDGTVDTFHTSSHMIGIQKNSSYDETAATLSSGDRIFLYTDGIPETENENKKMIGFEEQLVDLFKESNRSTISETLDNIIDRLNNFKGSIPFKDDIVLIGIEIK